MPGSTLAVVFGAWLVLLAMTVIYYLRHANEDDDAS